MVESPAITVLRRNLQQALHRRHLKEAAAKASYPEFLNGEYM